MVRFQLEFPLSAGGILVQDLVHDVEQLFHPLILSEILPSLHQVIIFPFVVTANRYPLRLPNGGHHHHLVTHDIGIKGMCNKDKHNVAGLNGNPFNIKRKKNIYIYILYTGKISLPFYFRPFHPRTLGRI